MDSTGWRRRACLTALGSAVGALAGCPSDGSTSPTPTGTTERGTQTATGTATDGSAVVRFDGGGAAAFADALNDLRSTPGGELRLAPGTYRFDASQAPTYEYPREDDRVHFDGTGLDDVTIAGPSPDADGTAEVVLSDPTRGFLAFHNPNGATATNRPRGPTVRDLTVRHDPLPFTQGRIDALSTDRRTVTLALESGFPAVDEPPFRDPDPLLVSASVFTADGDRLRRVTEDARSNFKRFDAIDQVNERRVELRLADGTEPGGLAVGRRLTLLPRHRNGTLFIHTDLTEPTYERVTVRSTPNFAFEFNACDRPTVRDSLVAPRADGPALVATTADGVHCNNCPRGPLVERCTFRRLSDDAVVADAELMAVEGFADERTVRVYADFGTRVGSGDQLTAVTSRLEPVDTLPAVAEVDERGGGVTTAAVNPELITFAEPVEDLLSVGDALVGPRMRNSDTVVRDNTVREIRARFVRFGGVSGGRIERNTFEGTNSDGVEISASGDVREGFSDLKGWSSDVVVRENDIVDTGLVGVPSGIPRGIFVGADGGEGPAPTASVTGRPHENIEISDNTVRGTAGLGIEVADAVGVTLAGNRIEEPAQIPVTAAARYGLGVRHAADVTVRGTAVTTAVADTAFGWRAESEDIVTEGNTFTVADGERAATLATLRSP